MVGAMERFEHGGDVHAHAGAIDFSASLNPLGMPREAADALRANVADFEAYPDTRCRKLKAKLARKLGVPEGWVVCTAGASDLIQRACLALMPHTALVTAPCFSGYEQALELVEARIERYPLREERDFDLDEGFARAVESSRAGLVFLCSPNNPTGRTVSHSVLASVLEAASSSGAVLVLDECFLDFTGCPSAAPLCGRYPNLIVVRAFTKLYAMAGLRLGYGICSDADTVASLERAGLPWAVSAPAQLAGIAALDVAGWEERTRSYVARERARLSGQLAGLGMRVVPSEANYLLFYSPKELYGPLLERGILVRRCDNFEGLGPGWYRIAVRTEHDNALLAAALEEVVAHGR